MSSWKAFTDSVKTSWHRSRLEKARLIAAACVMACCVTGTLFDPPWWWGVFTVGVGAINVVLVLWISIWANLTPIVLRRATTIAAEGSNLTETILNDMSWVSYRLRPPVIAWCRENCRGFYGVLPRRDKDPVGDRRVFWFTHSADAFAFKMRWIGAPKLEVSDG